MLEHPVWVSWKCQKGGGKTSRISLHPESGGLRILDTQMLKAVNEKHQKVTMVSSYEHYAVCANYDNLLEDLVGHGDRRAAALVCSPTLAGDLQFWEWLDTRLTPVAAQHFAQWLRQRRFDLHSLRAIPDTDLKKLLSNT